MAALRVVDGSRPPPLSFPSWSERSHSRLRRTGERSPEIDRRNCGPQRPRNQQPGRQNSSPVGQGEAAAPRELERWTEGASRNRDLDYRLSLEWSGSVGYHSGG